MSITSAIDSLKNKMLAADIQPENGLGTELFLFSSTLMPVVNVDLLVSNEKREILLAWRDDPHTGTGWHIPGGCIRFREKLADRIHKTAISEFGTEVSFNPEPIKVFEIFSNECREKIEDQRERAHFITLVFACKLDAKKTIPLELERSAYAGKPGYLKWFSKLPDNLLSVQKCYRESWSEIREKLC